MLMRRSWIAAGCLVLWAAPSSLSTEEDFLAAQAALARRPPYNDTEGTVPKLATERVLLRLKRDGREGGGCTADRHPESSPFEHEFWAKFGRHGQVFCEADDDDDEHATTNATRVTCFSDKAGLDRPTYCTATNLFGVCRGGADSEGRMWNPPDLAVAEGSGAAQGRPTACKWRAFCRPTAAYHAYRKRRGSKFPRGDSFGEILRFEWPPPYASELAQPLDERTYYLANGDCASPTFNPAHCVADVVIAYAMRRSLGVLPEDPSRTVAALANGFNSVKEGTPFYDLWRALAGEVVTQPDQAPARRVAHAVFSAPSFISPTWRSNHACVGERTSPLLTALQRDLAPVLDATAGPRWVRWLQGDSSAKSFRHQSRVSPAATWVAGPPPPPPPPPAAAAGAGNFVLFALRCPPDAGPRLERVAPKDRPRCIWNFEHLWQAARAHFPTVPLLAVHLSPDVDFMAQYALFRRARLIVGLHGGQLGHALWLREAQGMLEIGHDRETNNPSMFAGMSTAAGGAFRWLGTPPPMTKKNGGDVNVVGVLRDMAEMLGVQPATLGEQKQAAAAAAGEDDARRMYSSSSSRSAPLGRDLDLSLASAMMMSSARKTAVTFGRGDGAGFNYMCAEKDALPRQRSLVGTCVIACQRSQKRPFALDEAGARSRCTRAFQVCGDHGADCAAVDVNKMATFATLKAARPIDPPDKFGCPPSPDVGAC